MPWKLPFFILIYHILSICEILRLYPASSAWNEPCDTLRIATPLAVASTRGPAQGPPYLQTSLPDANLTTSKSCRSPCTGRIPTLAQTMRSIEKPHVFTVDKLPKTWIRSWPQTISNAFVAVWILLVFEWWTTCVCFFNFCPMLQDAHEIT